MSLKPDNKKSMEKTMTIKQLAENYDTTTATVRKWFRINTDLYNDLIASGWRNRQKLLTPKQVLICKEHLGDFETSE